MTAPAATDSSLRGRCALITGSTQGLGLAAARAFAAAGCSVMLNGLAPIGEAAALRADLEARFHVRAGFSGADLRRANDIERMVADAAASLGAVDILVNNAVVRHSDPIERFPIDKWDEALAVNVSAAFHTIRLALPGMRDRNWGRIINVSSIYGLRGATNRIGYVAAKTALIGVTRAVALETAGQNITCNAICPGTVETPVHEVEIERLIAEGATRADAERRFLAAKQPTGRFISADGVAAFMVFLCGPEAADISGAALPIDGGWAIR